VQETSPRLPVLFGSAAPLNDAPLVDMVYVEFRYGRYSMANATPHWIPAGQRHLNFVNHQLERLGDWFTPFSWTHRALVLIRVVQVNGRSQPLWTVIHCGPKSLKPHAQLREESAPDLQDLTDAIHGWLASMDGPEDPEANRPLGHDSPVYRQGA
jgi:hypothetical protein